MSFRSIISRLLYLLSAFLLCNARTSMAASTSTEPCAYIFESGGYEFNATDAYACLTSMPFNSTVATNFLTYFRDTLEFQSTLAYLKSPPKSYQQPSIDLLGGIDLIQDQIDSGVFTNEYAFEAAVLRLAYAAHDYHLDLVTGGMSIFSFGSPFRISSTSDNGVQLPKVFLTDNLFDAKNSGAYKASAIATINGQKTADYLSRYAMLNSLGNLEPHADWNELMWSAAADIQGYASSFDIASPFYTGDHLDISLENGTVLPRAYFTAYLNNYQDVDITNGTDLYNFFVLGLPVGNVTVDADGYDYDYDSYYLSSTTSRKRSLPTIRQSHVKRQSSTSDRSSSWLAAYGVDTYPSDPAIVQPGLGSNGGIITGYFLKDISVAILSLPSFELNPEAVQSFSQTIGYFLSNATEAGMKKVVIDLQQNHGGELLLAYDAFKQFFPEIQPFGGSRLRSFELANTIGQTFTTFFDDPRTNQTYHDGLIDEPWVASAYINANTARNFESWNQLYGPHLDNGDYFTTVIRNNFSDPVFDMISTGGFFDEDSSTIIGGITVYGYANRPFQLPPPPFAAKDIVLLTDGMCASSCATFVELMHHEANVKTIVVGGLPQIGPMQAVGGTRGALEYSTFSLDADMEFTRIVNSTSSAILPNRTLTMELPYLSINLADQIRFNEYIPLQFAYEAADCRIFYTVDTIIDYSQLWRHAATAAWTDPSLCVKDSLYTPFPPGARTDTTGPSAAQKQAWRATGPYATNLGTTATPSNATINYDNILLDNLILDSYSSLISHSVNCAHNPGICSQLNPPRQCAWVETCKGDATSVAARCVLPCQNSKRCASNHFCNLKDKTCVWNPNSKKLDCFAPPTVDGYCERLATPKTFKCKSKTVAPNPQLTAAAQHFDYDYAVIEDPGYGR